MNEKRPSFHPEERSKRTFHGCAIRRSMNTMRMWNDSHIHLDQMTDEQRAWALRKGRAGRYRALVPGVHPEQWFKAFASLGEHDWIDFAVGVHPWEVGDSGLSAASAHWRERIEEALAHPSVVAIGEIGLDALRWQSSEAKAQGEALFVQQLEIARSHKLPVALHVVGAHSRAVELLKKHGLGVRGVVHAFGGSLEEYRAYAGLGLAVGFGSMVTRAHARRVRRAAAEAGEGTWMLETDAPFMTVGETRRGEGPAKGLLAVIEAMVDVRRAPEEDIMREAWETYQSVFVRRGEPTLFVG